MHINGEISTHGPVLGTFALGLSLPVFGSAAGSSENDGLYIHWFPFKSSQEEALEGRRRTLGREKPGKFFLSLLVVASQVMTIGPQGS